MGTSRVENSSHPWESARYVAVDDHDTFLAGEVLARFAAMASTSVHTDEHTQLLTDLEKTSVHLFEFLDLGIKTFFGLEVWPVFGIGQIFFLVRDLATMFHDLLLTVALLFKQSFQFGPSLSHNVEQVASDGASVSQSHEPNLATDGTWQSTNPHITHPFALFYIVPIRQDFLFPRPFALLESELPPEPLHASAFDYFAGLCLTSQERKHVFSWDPIAFVKTAILFDLQLLVKLFSEPNGLHIACQGDILVQSAEFRLHPSVADILLLQSLSE